MSRAERVLAALAVAVLLSGCTQHQWVKAGTTDAELRRDLAQCESREEQQQHGGRSEGRGPSLEKTAVHEGVDRCMAARGYTK
jgi:hypothetical protein